MVDIRTFEYDPRSARASVDDLSFKVERCQVATAFRALPVILSDDSFAWTGEFQAKILESLPGTPRQHGYGGLLFSTAMIESLARAFQRGWGSLYEGQLVDFLISETPGGPTALGNPFTGQAVIVQTIPSSP